MTNKNNDASKKMNETFGQYDATQNKASFSIAPDSEDDKPQPKKPDLSLKHDGIGNNDSPVQPPAMDTTKAKDKISEQIVHNEEPAPSKKMNESFGQYDAAGNKKVHSIAPNSEDDKPHPKKPDLRLKHDGIGNNDSPVQHPTHVVTPEQKEISDQIMAEEEKLQAMNNTIKEELDQMHTNVESYIDEVEDEYKEAGGLAGLAKEKAEQLKQAMEDDPKATLCDLGKKALIVIGAFSVLKAIFRH